MNFPQLQALLVEARKYYPEKNIPEKNIFSVGARGHFENPTTELLAFFLDSDEAHNLENHFLCGLLNCLPDGKTLPAELIRKPCREVPVASDEGIKRMDLLLYGKGWGLLLENKINSGLNNPLDKYEAFFNELCESNGWKTRLLVLLSPSGTIPKEGWQGLVYTQLIAAIREQLQGHDVQASGKWWILANEFLLHLENLTGRRAMDDAAFDFAIKRLVPHIRELNTLYTQAIRTLKAKIDYKLQKDISVFKPNYGFTRWPEGPALRYSHDGWWIGNSISEVTLYLCIQKGRLRPLVQVYLVHMSSDLEQRARKQFGQDGKQESGDVLRFEWSFDEFDQ